MEDTVHKSYEVFISYAHDDSVYVDLWKKEFNKYISSREIQLKFWSDHNLVLGEDWDEEIVRKVWSCDFAILLVSQNFLGSTYIKEKEFDGFLKRNREKGFLFFPIFIEPTNIQQWPELSKIQFFKPKGTDYDFAHKSDFSFADLVKFNPTDGTILPNPNRSRYYNHLADKLFEAVKLFTKRTLSTNVNIESNKSTKEKSDIEAGLSLIQESVNEISAETERDKVEEFIQLRKSFLNEAFDISTNKLINTPNLNEIYSLSVCKSILESEIINPTDLIDVVTIRSDREKFTWYQRAQVVVALSLSTLRFRKIDSKKIDLLIDFLLDQEEGVWQRSLLAVYLNITYHHNRIKHRCPAVIPKLLELQKIPIIQDSLVIIEHIIASRLYRKVEFPVNLKNWDFFNEKLNWFLPFFPENRILDSALDFLPNTIELDKFTKYMLAAPLLESWKYAICLAITQDQARFRKINLQDESKENRPNFDISKWFSIPYLNLITEYSQFIVSNNLIEKNVLDENPSIYNTSLKTIILSNYYLKKVEANRLIDAGQTKGAYKLLKDIYTQDKSDYSIVKMLIEIGIKLKEYDYLNKLNLDLSKLTNRELKSILFSGISKDCTSKINDIIIELEARKLDEIECYDILNTIAVSFMDELYLSFAQKSIAQYPKSNLLRHKLAWAFYRNDYKDEMCTTFQQIDPTSFNAEQKYDYHTLKFYYHWYLNSDKDLLKQEIAKVIELSSINNYAGIKLIKHYNNMSNFYMQLKYYDMAYEMHKKLHATLTKEKLGKKESELNYSRFYLIKILLALVRNENRKEINALISNLEKLGWSKKDIADGILHSANSLNIHVDIADILS